MHVACHLFFHTIFIPLPPFLPCHSLPPFLFFIPFSYDFTYLLTESKSHAHICPIMFKWATPLAWGYVSSLLSLARIHHHLIDANQHASILSPFHTISLFNVSDIILQPLIISSIASCLLDYIAAISFFILAMPFCKDSPFHFFKRHPAHFPATQNHIMN